MLAKLAACGLLIVACLASAACAFREHDTGRPVPPASLRRRSVPADAGYLSRPVDLVHESSDVSTIVSELEARAGIRVALAPAAFERHVRLSVHLRGVTWLSALEHVVERSGLRVSNAVGGILLEDRAPAPRVTLALARVDLRRAIAEIVRASPWSLVVAPDVEGTLDLDVRDEVWTKALLSVLRPRDLHAVVRGEVLLVSRSPAEPGQVELGEDEPARPVRWPLRPLGLPPGEIDVDVEDADLHDLLDEIGRRAQLPVLAEPGLTARVTLKMRRTPWPEVLDVIAHRTHGEIRSGSGLLLLRTRESVNLAADADARTILQLLAAARRKNVVIGSDVCGSLRVDLRDVDWLAAVSVVASACRVQVERVGPRAEVTVFTTRTRAMPEATPGDSLVDGLDDGLAPGEQPGRAVDVSVEGADLRDVADELGRRVGHSIVVSPEVHETVTTTLRRVPWQRTLEVVSRLASCRVTPLPGDVLVLEQPPPVSLEFTDASTRVVLLLLGALSGKNVLVSPDVGGTTTVSVDKVDWALALCAIARGADLHVSETAPGVLLVSAARRGPEPAAARPDTRWRAADDPPGAISLSVREADLADCLASIRSETGAVIALGPDVHEKLTVSLRRIDWRDALDVIARVTRCEIRRRGGTITLEQTPWVTLQATDVSAEAWFALLARLLGRPVRVARDVTAKLTGDLHGVTFETALAATAEAYGLRVTRDHAGAFDVTVGPGPKLVPAVQPVYVPARRGPPRTDWARVRGLVTRIDTVFERLESSLADRELDKLTPILEELARLMNDEGLAGAELVQLKLDQRRRALEGQWNEACLGIQLLIDISVGNDHLRAMLRARSVENYQEVFDNYERLTTLVARMRLEIRDEFHRNATAILDRGKALRDEAIRLAEIRRRFPLTVRAIALDPRPGGRNRAVISLGSSERIYEEDDSLEGTDPRAAVTLVKVAEGSLRLRFEETEFIRELEAPN